MRILPLFALFACTPNTVPDVPSPGTSPGVTSLVETVPDGSAEVSISPPGKTFTGTLSAEISGESGLTFRYTTDGTLPSEVDGTDALYEGPITVSDSTFLQVRAFRSGMPVGEVVAEAYLAIAPDLVDFDSNLPLVVIDSFGTWIDDADPSIHHPVTSVFLDTDADSGRASILGPVDHAGLGGMHIRGQSTMGYEKRQYKFETWDPMREDEKVSLLGMPADGDWILHAPYADKTLMRNHLMYKWSNDIGRYAVRTQFVEVFVATDMQPVGWDDYQGVYVLMEKVERHDERVDIAKLDVDDTTEPDISGGYLFKKDRLQEPWFTTSTYYDELLYVDPEVEDLSEEAVNWLQNHFDSFEAALAGPNYTDPVLGYGPYIDADTFADHLLLVEMGRNVDGYILSTFVYKDREGPISMGPIWDFNGGLGNADYFCAYAIVGWQYEFDDNNCGFGFDNPRWEPAGFAWYARLLTDPAYVELQNQRWQMHRTDTLTDAKLMADIDEVRLLLTDNGAVDNPMTRNFERWPVLQEYVWPNTFCCGTYDEHVDWMKDWLTQRLVWMDGQLQ